MGNQYHKEEIKVKLNQINTADDIMDLLGSGERPGTAERLQAFKIKKRKHTDQQVIQSKSQSQDLTEQLNQQSSLSELQDSLIEVHRT